MCFVRNCYQCLTATTFVYSSLPRVSDNLQILCVFLICERHRGKASFWWPYVNTLPTSYTIPSYWTSAELHLLPHPSRESALRQIRDMKDSYDSASPLFRAVEKEWTEFEDIFTFEAYRWAWSTVNTRAVFMPHDLTTLESGDPHGNPAKCLALAPLLDLLNHSSHVEVSKSCCQYSLDYFVTNCIFLDYFIT